MFYLSEPCRKLLEATLCNLYRFSERSAELPEVAARLSTMTDAELEQSLDQFLLLWRV